MQHWNIAIDGPAGAGKSTIAKKVAKELGILYLDTGAMYRALALKALRMGIEPGDRTGVVPILAVTEITAKSIEGIQHTYIDGEDVSKSIRTAEISQGASAIGVIPEVRAKMVEAQQKIAEETDVVMDGRDICLYVLPKSENKFFITASSAERARRRLKEMQEKGEYLDVSLAQMQKEIEDRDYRDTHRSCSPLVQAPDAALLDTTNMNIETAVQTLLALLKKRV